MCVVGGNKASGFALSDTPELRVLVTNHNPRGCRVVVKAATNGGKTLIDGGPSSKSDEQEHAGRREGGKRQMPYTFQLSFLKPGDSQVIKIKLYMCGRDPKRRPKLIGEYDQYISVA